MGCLHMTDHAFEDYARINAEMERIAKEKAEALAYFCSCDHPGVQFNGAGERVCSGCMKPKDAIV